MNTYYITKKKEINKHLSFNMYEFIQSEYNRFISKKNNIKKTEFMKNLAKTVGTSLSNLYEIINDGLITILGYELEEIIEFSASSAWNKRSKKSIESNASKKDIAKPFIELVIKEFRSKMNINSIDEIINDLKRNRPDEIEGMITICTATFYNYVDAEKIPNFDKYELPMKMKRTKENEPRKGKTKGKGDSIELRPFKPDDRSEFGHWEADLIVGGTKEKQTGAVLTLVERQTRHLLTVKLKNKTKKGVVKAFHKLAKLYPDFSAKDVFKTITFDNGSEFSDFKKIAKYLKASIYFAHPYSSWERGSNENCNRLLRLFFPKGCNFSNYTEDDIMTATELINNKIRKILGYKSSLDLFNDQLALLAA